jgi:hypothetical protein
MALKMYLSPIDERCDICQKIDATRPMLQLVTTGRTRDDKNSIWVHLDEFERRFEKLKESATK